MYWLSRYVHFGLAVCLAIGLAPAQAAEMQTRVRQDGNWLMVDGWLAVNVDATLAWQVLTDYERFPSFVPGIHSNRVLAADNGRKLVEQQGEMLVGSLRMPYGGQMQIQETRGQGLDIRFISGLFKDVQGEWRIEPRKPLK